jgi:hypothetical protein
MVCTIYGHMVSYGHTAIQKLPQAAINPKLRVGA